MRKQKKEQQTFRSVYMKEKYGVKYIKRRKEKLSIVWKRKDNAVVDCDNTIDMVNREKVEEFCKAAEKEEQAAVDIVQPNRDSLQY